MSQADNSNSTTSLGTPAESAASKAEAIFHMVFEMEDDIRSARDWADALYERLSRSGAGAVDFRMATEILNAVQKTNDAYDKLFDAVKQLKEGGRGTKQ
jgi:hypothetical protein